MKKILSYAMVVFLLTAFCSARSQPAVENGWTPEFSFSLKRVTETQISPHARYIAYVVREALMTEDKSEFQDQIHVAAVDSSFDRQYTFGDKLSWSPRFSPDGDRLAFLSSRSGTDQIYVMWINGGEAEQLTHAPSSVNYFRWSPDGSKIAYLMTDPESSEEKKQKEEKTDIVIVDQNFRNRHIYVTGSVPGVHPDSLVKQITNGNLTVNDFDWSPDGKLIVFSYQPDPDLNTGIMHSDISIVSSDSGKIQKMVDWPGVDDHPLFSPNGKQIAFCSQGGRPEPLGLKDLYTIPVHGGKPVRLTLTPDRNASLISWSPDGKSLFASELMGTSFHLLAVRVKGEEMAVVTLNNRPLPGINPALTPEGSNGTFGKFSVAKNAWAISCTYQETGKPEEVFYSELINYHPRKVSSINKDVSFPPVAPTELVHWTSKDGTVIEGLLTYPAGYEKGKKYPLILNIHGGPASAFTQYFTGIPTLYLIQDMAREGYAVLRPNPRGSSGYGKEFRYANAGNWGFDDYDDLMAGVDTVVKIGLADRDRLYVAGWSYGGYLTSFIITRTGRFRAASMGAGLPDLVSMVNTTDIPDYLVANMGNELWNDYDGYMKHSAIFQLKEIHTPLQVLHGQNDRRVPVTQGTEIYEALKRNGDSYRNDFISKIGSCSGRAKASHGRNSPDPEMVRKVQE